jgi:hypothetical protein
VLNGMPRPHVPGWECCEHHLNEQVSEFATVHQFE